MNLSRILVVSDMKRYSGPEPQPLPFPLELVAQILSYLDEIYDKKNARLVCKGFAAAGLTSLTSTVYFSTSLIQICYRWNESYCSSSTQNIAMHPVVSKYITKLVCDGTQFPDYYYRLGTFRKWWAFHGQHRSCSIQSIHDMYVSRDRQEKWIIGQGEDRKILRTALEQFIHLKCIVFTDIAADRESRDLPRMEWPPLNFDGDIWGPSSPYHTFAMCIRLLSEMAIKLRELYIEGGVNGISHLIFSRISPQDYSHLCNVFANLRKISLNVRTSRSQYDLEYAGLGRFLAHATLLQSLDLKCAEDTTQSRLHLSQLFQDTTWPYLKHFGLHDWEICTDAELIAFFNRHRTVIESVTLQSIRLHKEHTVFVGTPACEVWKHFFGELRTRSITFKTLELYKIYDRHNWEGKSPEVDLASRADYGEKILRYLRDGGPNPLESSKTRIVNV